MVAPDSGDATDLIQSPSHSALPSTPKSNTFDARTNRIPFTNPTDAHRMLQSPPPSSSSTKQLGRGSMQPQIMRFSHLPTPQSPSHFTPYSGTLPQLPLTPQTPVQHGLNTGLTSLLPESKQQRTITHQMMTPDSSPLGRRRHPPETILNSLVPSTPEKISVTDVPPSSPEEATPRPITPATSRPTPSSSLHSLSSPFMAKVTINDKQATEKTIHSSPLHTPDSDTTFFAPINPNNDSSSNLLSRNETLIISTPPTSPPLSGTSGKVIPGGDLDRLRQAMIQERLSQMKDLEARRPDYLKRTKRTLAEADPLSLTESDNMVRSDNFSSVGITDSPNKGRRIKLFQETSEESFEESLMAGGYGRYRTAEWVRQPQPTVLPNSVVIAGSEAASVSEDASPPPAPLTEREVKKQKRLAAFRSDFVASSDPPNRLFPVELLGRGRVLLDLPNEHLAAENSVTSTKKRGSFIATTVGPNSRRKKRVDQPSAKERRSLAAAALAEELADKPNWPDAEFPWRVRTEERAEIARAEEVERLKWIEKFLDRDTDDEDDGAGDGNGTVLSPGGSGITPRIFRSKEEDEEVISSSHWGLVYDDEADPPVPARWGRGKMVPLRANPTHRSRRKKSSFFPSDPADAKAALLSKKSVRALSYRQQRRLRVSHDSDEEVVCTCRGTDDGRELVQCDICKMWFHLECIGIHSIAELGKEEDPWFCQDCSPNGDPSSDSEPEAYTSEPTFVPTDEFPRARNFDGTIFQASSSLQDSPGWGKIPKSPRRNYDDYRYGAAPSTPRHHPRAQNGVAFTQDVYGRRHSIDDVPFDPTSTPSRGLKFDGHFMTPKHGSSSRAHATFQTPSKLLTINRSARSGPILSSSYPEESPWSRVAGYEDSPVRRSLSTEGSRASRPILNPSRHGPLDFSSVGDNPTPP